MDQITDGITANPSCFKTIIFMMVDPFCIEMVFPKMLEHDKNYEIIGKPAYSTITSVVYQPSGQLFKCSPFHFLALKVVAV